MTSKLIAANPNGRDLIEVQATGSDKKYFVSVSNLTEHVNSGTHTRNNVYDGTSTFNGAVTYGDASGQILTATATLTATTIVGVAAGDIGHADGAVLIAAPGSGKAIQFISATIVYDFATAAYTGGGDDCAIIFPGFNAVSGTITSANLLGAAGDKIVSLMPLAATGTPMVVNTGLNFAGTAWTNPGTAAGVLRFVINYRILTTNL